MLALVRFRDQLAARRDDNSHMAFGYGILLRRGAAGPAGGQIAISTLPRRLPDIQLAAPSEYIHWRLSVLMRGLRHLPVTFRPTVPILAG